jgi:hypothetical protein
VVTDHLPGALLGRLNGCTLMSRLCRLLYLLAPVSTASWPGCVRVALDPQKM